MPFRPLPSEDLDHVLTHTRQLWPEVRGRRIFLTGGTGFFGPWLVETFAHANDCLSLGAELVVLTRDPAATVERLPHYARLGGVTLHRGDVRDFDRPPGAFEVVINGAAESSQQGHVGDQQHMFDTIVSGARETLGLARAAGSGRYLLISSGAVYGRQPAELSHIGEEYTGGPDLTDARSAYAEGKRAAEMLATIAAGGGGPSVRVGRCFAFVGPHLPLGIHFAIGNFIRDAMAGGPIRIAGDGTAVRSYLYMADLAIWLWTLALGNAAGTYNIGSESAVSILETAYAVAASCAPSIDIVVEGRDTPSLPGHRYVPSTRRIRQDLGAIQRVSFHDAIRRTVEWYRLSPLRSA
jgi:dTDP-glucose 4,6-dehydratase